MNKPLFLALILFLTLASCEKSNLSAVGQSNTTIPSIQGCSHQSPYLGQKVNDVEGIVTTKSYNGFYMQSEIPDSLACTAQLLNPDKSIQPTGGFFPNLFNVFTLSTGLDDLPLINSVIKPIHPHSPSFYTHDNFYQSDHPQDWITGAFILIRRSAFLATGGFDQKYFMYGEELEWFYRLRLHYPRSTVWYLVGPQIIHLGGASSLNKNYPIIKEIHGIIAFFKLHRPHWQYLFIKFILKINPSLRLRALFFSVFGPQAKANFYRQSCSQI